MARKTPEIAPPISGAISEPASIMQGGLNIIKILTQVKLDGIAPSLEVYTNWDNCKDIQDAPELHVGFRGGITVITIQTMSLIDEDDGVALIEPLTTASRQPADHVSKMDEKRKATRCGRKVTNKYSSDEYGK